MTVDELSDANKMRIDNLLEEWKKDSSFDVKYYIKDENIRQAILEELLGEISHYIFYKEGIITEDEYNEGLSLKVD